MKFDDDNATGNEVHIGRKLDPEKDREAIANVLNVISEYMTNQIVETVYMDMHVQRVENRGRVQFQADGVKQITFKFSPKSQNE